MATPVTDSTHTTSNNGSGENSPDPMVVAEVIRTEVSLAELSELRTELIGDARRLKELDPYIVELDSRITALKRRHTALALLLIISSEAL